METKEIIGRNPVLEYLRALEERVAEQLRRAGHELGRLGLDPILGLQSALTVNAVEGTQVVELAASGADPELPAALLVGIGEVYREHVAQTYLAVTRAAAANTDDEVTKLEAAVAAKRKAVEDFRVRHSIVSPEREENSILAEMQGLAAAQRPDEVLLDVGLDQVEVQRLYGAQGLARLRVFPTVHQGGTRNVGAFRGQINQPGQQADLRQGGVPPPRR